MNDLFEALFGKVGNKPQPSLPQGLGPSSADYFGGNKQWPIQDRPHGYENVLEEASKAITGKEGDAGFGKWLMQNYQNLDLEQKKKLETYIQFLNRSKEISNADQKKALQDQPTETPQKYNY